MTRIMTKIVGLAIWERKGNGVQTLNEIAHKSWYERTLIYSFPHQYVNEYELHDTMILRYIR